MKPPILHILNSLLPKNVPSREDICTPQPPKSSTKSKNSTISAAFSMATMSFKVLLFPLLFSYLHPKDGNYYSITPVNPIFLALFFLDKARGKVKILPFISKSLIFLPKVTKESQGKLCQLDEIFNESLVSTKMEKVGLSVLQESKKVKESLKSVCYFNEQSKRKILFREAKDFFVRLWRRRTLFLLQT